MNKEQPAQNLELAQQVIGSQQGNMYFTEDYHPFHATSTSIGSGKTRVGIDYMLCAENASRNFIYVAPTKGLVNQTKANLVDRLKEHKLSTRNVNLIHTDTIRSDERASSVAINTINDTLPNIGAVMIITTITFLTILPMIKGKENWHVILDEAFSPLEFVEYQLGKLNRDKGREYFNSLFQVMENDNDNVLPSKGKHSLVQSVASGDWEEAGTHYEGMHKLAQCVLNDSLRVELAGRHDNKFVFASYVTPEYFSQFTEVIFMAALFEQSILYQLWKGMFDIEFREHEYFNKTITHNVHETQGKLVSIGYLLNEADNTSKHSFERNYKTGEVKEKELGKRVIDKMILTACKYFKDTPFLLQVNKWTGYKDRLQHKLTKEAKVIPTVAHGLNKFTGYHAIAALASTNPQSHEKAWVKQRTGLTDDEVYRAYRIHTIYQACGRTAIRDWTNDKPVVFLVASHDDAMFLHQLFNGSTWLGQIGDLPRYSPKLVKVSDNPEYQALRREQKRLREKVRRMKATDAEKDKLKEITSKIDLLKRASRT